MKVRVLVINLNNKKYTETCINLLLNQKYDDFKITLFDQNSNEFGTEKMLNHFIDKGIDVIKNKTNDPVNSVWNWFYKNYTEDILCFLNNDVLIYDNFISDIVFVFKNEPKVGIAVHSTNHNDYTIKKTFDEWLEQIIDTNTFRLNYPPVYERDVRISQLNQRHQRVYTAILKNAYPVSTNSISLSNASQNEISRFEVTFTYSNYQV
jgi:glycosyltransferase involved in cell wall biosynthesis